MLVSVESGKSTTAAVFPSNGQTAKCGSRRPTLRSAPYGVICRSRLRHTDAVCMDTDIPVADMSDNSIGESNRRRPRSQSSVGFSQPFASSRAHGV